LPSGGYRPQLRGEAFSPPPWAGHYRNREAAPSRRKKVSTYAIIDPALVPHGGIRLEDINQALEYLRDLETQDLAWLNSEVLTPLLAHHDGIRPEDVNWALTELRDLGTRELQWYDDHAIRFPLATKATTSGICYAIGDLCAQGIAGKNMSTFDFGRSTRSGAAGFIGHGPVAHYWLNFLDTYLSFGGAAWSVFPKMVADQGAMAIMYNTIYSFLIGAFKLQDPVDIWKSIKAKFVPGFLASVRFWPAVNFLTFTVIPVELQLLWDDAFEIVWICILSGVNNDAQLETASAGLHQDQHTAMAAVSLPSQGDSLGSPGNRSGTVLLPSNSV
jgi:protein Mpv17